jgi:hypothetical protein
MLSLAALRYRDVFAEDGGPIERVLTGDFNILGQPCKQANAFLRPELTAGKSTYAIYGQADGTGSAGSGAIACHMAISEALERWAFLAVHNRPEGRRYGFDVDRSSNGMAAFPGMFRTQAAIRARFEALERFALISWWDGRLPAQKMGSPFPGVELVRIHHNAGEGEVVILVQHSRAGVSYGHAAGRTIKSAAFKAAVELARSDFVLVAHKARGALVQAANFFERRALHFATDEGHAEFEERLQSGPCRPAPNWVSAFDGEIPGPWSRWATVWRHAAVMPTDEYLNPHSNFFFW